MEEGEAELSANAAPMECEARSRAADSHFTARLCTTVCGECCAGASVQHSGISRDQLAPIQDK